MSYAILWNCNYFLCKNEFMMEIMFPLNSSELITAIFRMNILILNHLLWKHNFNLNYFVSINRPCVIIFCWLFCRPVMCMIWPVWNDVLWYDVLCYAVMLWCRDDDWLNYFCGEPVLSSPCSTGEITVRYKMAPNKKIHQLDIDILWCCDIWH